MKKEEKDVILNNEQHLKKMKEFQDKIVLLKEFEDIKIKEIKEFQLDKVIKNKPKLEVQEEEKETVICLKRKRDDESIPELFIEFQQNKKVKPTIEYLQNKLKRVKIEKEQVQKFTLTRKNLKDISGIFDKEQEKIRDENQKVRENVKLIKINQIRSENKNIIELSTENALNEKDIVYDYYTFEKRIEKQGNIPFYTFEEDLDFENEYEEEEKYEDDPDSNDENNPDNDYPDDEKEIGDSESEYNFDQDSEGKEYESYEEDEISE